MIDVSGLRGCQDLLEELARLRRLLPDSCQAAFEVLAFDASHERFPRPYAVLEFQKYLEDVKKSLDCVRGPVFGLWQRKESRVANLIEETLTCRLVELGLWNWQADRAGGGAGLRIKECDVFEICSEGAWIDYTKDEARNLDDGQLDFLLRVVSDLSSAAEEALELMEPLPESGTGSRST